LKPVAGVQIVVLKFLLLRGIWPKRSGPIKHLPGGAVLLWLHQQQVLGLLWLIAGEQNLLL
jgi:hypothetical protein